MAEEDGAGFAIFREIASWTRANCTPFEQSITTDILALSRYANFFSITALYFIGLANSELYVFIFGIAATLNWAFNLLLRVAVRDKTLASPLCVDAYAIDNDNWPSQQTQNAAFCVYVVATYCVLYGARVNVFHAFMLVGFFSFCVAGDIHLNYHTSGQVVGGALAGIFFGMAWQAVVRAFVVPAIETVLGLAFFRYYNYTDTLIRPTSHTKE